LDVALPASGTRADSQRAPFPRSGASRAGIAVACGYLAAAVALTWPLWAGLGTVAPAGDPADADLFAWAMRYVAHAVAHGQLPALVTTALNAPHGINLMWNTMFLSGALVMSPVTLLAGPQVSLTVLLTIGYAGSAAATYWVLRRHGASVLAAGLGGAVFGFSPALLVSGQGHNNWQFAVLAPLIVDAVLRIVTGRGRAVRTGAWLGVLAAAQLLAEEELLADIALMCLVLTVALAASRRNAVRSRLGPVAAGFAVAAVVVAVICGHALWVQFRGPLTEHGSPWRGIDFGSTWGAFVNAPAGIALHTQSSAAYAQRHGVGNAEYLAYLGWPLLVLTAVATIWYWRDLRVRVAGVTWAVLELLSLGGGSALLPFHWLQGLPLLVELLPDRLSILADGAAAAVLAFGLDLARSPAPAALTAVAVASPATGCAGPVPDTGGTHFTADRPADVRAVAGRVRAVLPTAVVVLALLPLVPRPMTAAAVSPVPAGWTTILSKLPKNGPVLVVPAPYVRAPMAMRWQADTGQPASLVAGWFIAPRPDQSAAAEYMGPQATIRAAHCLDALWAGAVPGPHLGVRACEADLRSALAFWRPAAIIADTSPDTTLGRLLRQVLGPPAVRSGQLLGWREGA
jgi:hypothetical protein